jgi:starch phosphorylase
VQQRVSDDFARPAVWATKAILNVARTGRFSSDRTILEYAREIWEIDRVV